LGWHAARFPTGWSGRPRITVGVWRNKAGSTIRRIAGVSTGFRATNAPRVRAGGLSIVRDFVPKPFRLIILKLDYTVFVCLKHAF